MIKSSGHARIIDTNSWPPDFARLFFNSAAFYNTYKFLRLSSNIHLRKFILASFIN